MNGLNNQALREKEKGDWKKLSLDEKKQLYRASFCQTLVEVEAPTGEWKAIFGWVMVWTSVAILSFVGVRKFREYQPYQTILTIIYS